MERKNFYAICFENGCNLYIGAESIADAAGDGIESLMSCMPSGFVKENMVRPTIIRLTGDFCSYCGVALAGENTITVKKSMSATGRQSSKCCRGCARDIVDAYFGEE